MQECHQQRQTITVLQREVDSLRGDNVKLYEKIKFLQSYPGTVRNVLSRSAHLSLSLSLPLSLSITLPPSLPLHLPLPLSLYHCISFTSHLFLSLQRKSVDDRETMSRYSSQYEANLDPFTAFNAKVSLH